MRFEKKNYDLVAMIRATDLGQARIEHARKLVEDPDRNKRFEKMECIPCYYGSRVGGSAITHSPCGTCGKELRFSNTCVDVLCRDCAEKHKACKHCGADIHLLNRRKLTPNP